MQRPHIELKAGDLTITPELLEKGFYVSRSTDKRLGRLRVQFETGNDDEKRSVDDFVGTGQPVDTDSDTARRWRIGEHSTSYSDNAPMTKFTWELLQIEDLKVEKLVIDGWELSPYKYSEEFDSKGVLTIHARVELTEADEERLHKLPMYLQVVRKGINDKAREMRFGQMLWSKKENEDKYRVGLLLVDKALDEHGSRHGLFEPQFGNLAVTAGAARLRLSRLLKKLVDKGVLSSEEAEVVRVLDDDSLHKELRENDRVDDLDEWLGDED